MAKQIQIAAGLLRLPDGRIVLNRRSRNAAVEGGLLAFYGGHVEAGETPEEAIKRELSEETSLEVDALKIEFLARFNVQGTSNKEFFLYELQILDADFKVYEGDHSEIFSRNEILLRQDIAPSVIHALEHILKK